VHIVEAVSSFVRFYIYDTIICCIGISWDPAKEEIIVRDCGGKRDGDGDEDSDGDGNGDGDGDSDGDSNGDGNGDGDSDRDGDSDGDGDNDGDGEEQNSITKLFKNANYKYDPRDPAGLRYSHLPSTISARYNFIKAERTQVGQLDEWKQVMSQAASRISAILSTKALTNSRSKKAIKQMRQELQHYVSPWS